MSKLIDGSKRLDKTLSLETFAYKDSVSLLVKNHLLKSPRFGADPKDQFLRGKQLEEVTQYWSSKIWDFLDDLRSASGKVTGKLVPTNETGGSSREWKLKDESDRYRVMYREGPVGTPYHTLCVDGAVDGDFTGALCVAWESPTFKEWWPQFMVPTFKITESKWLRRIRVGEDLSLLRFKVPWPLAPREVLISAFALEYLEEDLIIGLIDSVPDGVEVNEKVRGFSAHDLPPPSSNVKMDVSGGFVMQRSGKDQFFFRTVMNIDMKLDFVPPWLINFVSRQVAGQGLRLYQKAVTAISNDTGIGKELQKPLRTGVMYSRIRSGLEAKAAATGESLMSPPIERLPVFKDSAKVKSLQGSIRRMGSSENNRVVPYPVKAAESKEDIKESGTPAIEPVQSRPQSPPPVHNGRSAGEEVKHDVEGSSKHVISKSNLPSKNDEEMREYDDPEVEWALNILDKMILFTNSACAAESLHSRGESTSTDGSAPHSGDPHDNVRKPILPPVKSQSCSNLAEANPLPTLTGKLDNQESSRSPGWQLAGGDTGSSGGVSSFWSASEIEIVSSQDDTDTDVGRSGSITGQLKPEVPEVEVKQRRRKWRWTCFSPSLLRKPGAHGRTNFYARDSGRASEGHWTSLTGNPSRFTSNKGYLTDGDEIVGARQRLDLSGHSPDRFVTLGELLMDNER